MSTFHQDLVLIRKNRRLSMQDVFDKCRIPLETIQSIEDGSIFTGKVRNTTYLRSYLRSYGKSVGIADNDMVGALDAAQSGSYDRSLLKQYLPSDTADEASDDEPAGAPEATSKSEVGGAETSEGRVTADSSKSAVEEPTGDQTAEGVGVPGKVNAEVSKPSSSQKEPRKKLSITPESQEKSLEDVEWEDSTLRKPLSTSTTGFASAEPPNHRARTRSTAEIPDIDTVDWAGKIKSALYRPQRNRLLWVIIAISLALGLALAGGWWLWQRQQEFRATVTPVPAPAMESPGRSEEPDDPSAALQAPPANAGEQVPLAEVPAATLPTENETGSIPEPVLEEATPAEPIYAGDDAPTPSWTTESLLISGTPEAADTLFVVVYALHGNLEPVRAWSDIFSDNAEEAGPLRPYWVEQGDAMRFRFVDHITLQGNLSRMALVFNGHIIEDFDDLYLDGPRIRLTRSWILGNPPLLTPARTPFEQTPPPDVIVDRPRFSP